MLLWVHWAARDRPPATRRRPATGRLRLRDAVLLRVLGSIGATIVPASGRAPGTTFCLRPLPAALACLSAAWTRGQQVGGVRGRPAAVRGPRNGEFQFWQGSSNSSHGFDGHKASRWAESEAARPFAGATPAWPLAARGNTRVDSVEAFWWKSRADIFELHKTVTVGTPFPSSCGLLKL